MAENKMTFQEYRNRLVKLLRERYREQADDWITAYEPDFKEFYEAGFNPTTALRAMQMGY